MLEVTMLTAGFIVYMAVRALTRSGRDRAIANARSILQVEHWMGIAHEVDLQRWVLERPVVTTLFNNVYVWLFWPSVIVALAWLYRRDGVDFACFRSALVLSGLVGLLIFAVFPVAPPRLLDGFSDTVDESARAHFIAHPSGLTNPYAAMPSFHVGWTVLSGAVLARQDHRWRVRVVAVLPALFMSVAVIVTANHFVLDAIVGSALSLGSLWCIDRWSRVAPRPRTAVAASIQ